MNDRYRIFLSIILVSILALPGIINIASAEPDANLVIITPHWEGIQTEWDAAFKAYYLDKFGETVNIDWIYVGGTSDVVKYVDSAYEASPNTIQIDIFWGGGVDPFIAAKEKGQFQAYKISDEMLDLIPSAIAGVPMYDSDYMWYGSALSGFGIVYNKALLDIEGLPEPETWEDLTNPALKGWVGSADPRHSGSTHMMYEIILQAYGWEEGIKLSTQIGANIKTFPQSSSSVPRSVGAGDVAYGLAIDFYAWSEVDKHGSDKIGYVMPTGLTVINPDSIAILKGAPNLEVAQRFVDYVLSKEGQSLWMLPVGAEGGPTTYLLGRLCVIPELFEELADVTVVPINPFEVESSLDYDADLGSKRYTFLNDLIGATIIDSHEDLVTTWADIIATESSLTQAGVTSTKIEDAKIKLGEPPLSESESLMAVLEWGDAEIRNQYISDWHTFSVEKYESAARLAAAARTELSTHIESEREALIAQYEAQLDAIRAEKQNSMYTGLGGGLVVGLIIGYLISYYMARQREVSAI